MRVNSGNALAMLKSNLKQETVEFAGAVWYLQNHPLSRIKREGMSWSVGLRMKPTLIMIQDGVETDISLESDDILASDWVILEDKPTVNLNPRVGDVQR